MRCQVYCPAADIYPEVNIYIFYLILLYCNVIFMLKNYQRFYAFRGRAPQIYFNDVLAID